MASEALRQIYMRTPVGSCETAALTALMQLARDQDFEAIRAMAQIMAFELGGNADCPGFRDAAGPADLLRRDDVPLLCRLYALGCIPREYLALTPVCAILSTAEGPLATSAAAFAALQRLVTRESPLQHEVMKAVVLGAFAGHVDNAAAAALSLGSLMSAGARLATVDQIMGHCRIVPGNNATSEFEFGRDLILRSRGPEDLVFVINHEIGHRIFSGARPVTETGLMSSQLPQVLAALPAMLREAVGKPGVPVAANDTRRLLLDSGLSLLCSQERNAIGSAVHFSLTQQGGPIDLTIAASWAYAILSAIGVDLTATVAAYSPRGMMHFGFSGKGPAPGTVKQRITGLDPDALLADIHAKSRMWLASLREAGRFVRDERQWTVLVGLLPDSGRFYGINASLAGNDHSIASALHQPHPALPDDRKAGLAHVALRCGDARVLTGTLQTGDLATADLKGIGYSLCAFAHGGRTTYYGPTPEGVIDLLGALRSNGIDLDGALDDEGTTLLQQASLRSVETVRFLLAQGADVTRATARGRTPLLIAARFGSLACVQALVAAGAAIEDRDDDGTTPLMGAVRQQNHAMVRFILERGANPDMPDHKGFTPLSMARTAPLVQLLVDAGADVDAAPPGGVTALMQAAWLGRPDLVTALLEAGADVDAVLDDGRTALTFCPRWFATPDNQTCAALLLEAGADVDETTRDGVTPLMLAVDRVINGLAKLLLEAGANVEAADRDGNTALIRAMKLPGSARPSLVTLLLEAGADPRRANKSGETALGLIGSQPIDDEVRLLVERAADGGAR